MIIVYVKLNTEMKIIDIYKKAGRRLGMKLLDNYHDNRVRVGDIFYKNNV